jgi:hypothetical protein
MICEQHRRQCVVGERARKPRKGWKMEDVLYEPVELIDEDLDEVAGARQVFVHSFNGVGNDSEAIANNGNIVDAF